MCDSVWRGSRSHPQACWGAGRRPAAQGVGRSAPSREPEEGNRQSQAAPAPGHQRHRPTTLAGGGGLGWNARRSLGTFSCVPHPPRAGEPEAQEGLPLLCPLVLDPSGSQAGGSLPRRHFPEMVPALLHISGKATPALWVRKPALGWLIVGISGPGVRTCSGRVPELMAGPTPLWGTPLLNSHFRGCWGPRAESVTDRGLGQGLGGRAALGLLLWLQWAGCRTPRDPGHPSSTSLRRGPTAWKLSGEAGCGLGGWKP